MSRHSIAAPPPYEVSVGWDRQMRSFFAQVVDPSKEENDEEDGQVVLWVGASFDEIKTIGALDNAIRPYATIDEAMRAILWDDQKRGL